MSGGKDVGVRAPVRCGAWCWVVCHYAPPRRRRERFVAGGGVERPLPAMLHCRQLEVLPRA